MQTAHYHNSINGHSLRIGAANGLVKQGEHLEKIMLKGGCQAD